MNHLPKTYLCLVLLVLVISVSGWAQSFRHPGVINSRESLDFIKAKVATGQQPWLNAYNELKNHSLASLSRSPNPRAIVECGAYSNPNNGCTEERDDAAAAYAQAILWYIEGNSARAQKAIQYMDAWSAVIKDHTEHNARLQTGWSGSNWTKAAEIIRYTGAGWTSTGISRFETMLKTVYYPEIQNGAGGGVNGNWELTMIDAMIGIGVFCNDRAIFDKAVSMWRRRVPAYIYITSDGSTPVAPPGGSSNISSYWHSPGSYVEGLGQETCRDLGHLTFGFASMIYTAETALLQGVDLYNEQSRRIRAGLEYNARLNEGWTGNGICGGSVTRNMSETLEIGYNHYVNRKGFSMPYTLAFLNRVRPTGRGHHIVWETMTHGQTGDAHGGPPPVCGVTASSDDGNVPQNTVDGDFNTRWSADGDGQWIQYCLQSTISVSGVQIAFFKGNERSSRFDVLVSTDGTAFTPAATNLTSSGTSLAFETFPFSPRSAKYVRIVGHGNNLNTWNSYTEVEITSNVAPTVSITSPANNTVFESPASVTINATATDSDGTIAKVEFYNGATKLGEDLSSPYSFTWSNVGSGSYSLTAKAFDNAGATKTSTAVAITVNTLPTIAITSPANGATFTAPATITLSANASDANGTITKVEFYGNNTRLVEDFTAPYTFTWSNVQANSYTITAVATDNHGGQTVAAIDIIVNPSSCGPLPPPWQTADIGGVGAPGITEYCNGEFVISGSGADIWSTADEFRYVYQPASGDLELIARVNSITNTNAWAKAGLMVRESLTAGSINAAVFVSAASGVTFQRRTATGGTTVSTVVAGISAPVWLKLSRSGSNFTASRSADGITWTAIGTAAITMTASTQVGMAVTSHNDGTVATGRFTNVTVSAPCAAPFASADDGNVAANVIDNDLNTRWSASGDPQWIQLCLPALSSVSGVQIAFYKGNERNSRFDVLVSTDGTTFTPASENRISSGTSLALETFNFTPVNAKHVRIVGHGNNLNLWNSYTEVRINTGAPTLKAETIAFDDKKLNAFPNPTSAKVTITYHVEKPGRVTLSVYNSGNNRTIPLVDEYRTAGSHQTIFDTKELPAGVHVIKLVQEGKLRVLKLLKN